MPFCYRFAEVHIVKRTNRLKCISLTNWINWGHLHSIYHKNKRYSLRVFKKLENIQTDWFTHVPWSQLTRDDRQNLTLFNAKFF